MLWTSRFSIPLLLACTSLAGCRSTGPDEGSTSEVASASSNNAAFTKAFCSAYANDTGNDATACNKAMKTGAGNGSSLSVSISLACSADPSSQPTCYQDAQNAANQYGIQLHLVSNAPSAAPSAGLAGFANEFCNQIASDANPSQTDNTDANGAACSQFVDKQLASDSNPQDLIDAFCPKVKSKLTVDSSVKSTIVATCYQDAQNLTSKYHLSQITGP